MTRGLRFVLMTLLMLCLISTFLAFGVGKMGFSADLAAVQDIFLGKGSFQVSLDFRTMLSEEFQIRIPLSCTINGTSFLGESGIVLVYYPWAEGPFMGLSVFQAGFSQGSDTLDNFVNLNEVLLGWTFEFGPGLFVEPCLAIRDPSGTFSDEYSRLKGAFPCYTTFRGRLSFGWYFWR
ncbi:MAG TPA: hypothetical protein DCP98_09100 [Sphaerochaeta sp.]|nr:hypothetical protein [Sphaerochaeta sp.]